MVILGLMNGDGAATGVGLLNPLGGPPHDGRRARRGEVLVEHAAVPVSLLGIGDIAAPLGLGVLHHLVGDLKLGLVLEGVDPSVSDTVGELLLLAVEDVVGEVGTLGLVLGVEGLAEDVLLELLLGDHLLLGIDVHGNLEELLVEEGHAGLKTPSRGGLVGAQAVGQVEVLDATDALLVELLLVGSAVEVEVTAEDLIGALTRENHLDTHGLDLAREEVHGGRGTDGGDIVGLEVVDDIGKRVKTVLNSEGHDVVLGAEELGDLKGGLVVGRAGETDGEGVELGKESDGRELVIIIDTDETLALVLSLGVNLLVVGSLLLSELPEAERLPLGNSSNQRRIKTTGKKDTVGNLSHQTFPDGLLKSLAENLEVERSLGALLLIPPRGLEVTGGLASQAVENMAGRESLDLVANGVEGLELGGEVDGAGLLGVVSLVEGRDTDRVAGGDRAVLLLVVENEREHAIEVLGGIDAMLEVLHRIV